MSEPINDGTEFEQELDAIVSSDDALKSALQSDERIVRTAARLANNNHPTLSASSREKILSSMMDVAPTKTIILPKTPTNVTRGNFTAWVGRIAAMLIITVLVGLVAQPVSANSLPGDALYPVKRGFETLELVLARTPSARVETYLEHAEERLREAGQLGQVPDLIDSTVQSALVNLNLAVITASDNAVFVNDTNLAEETAITLGKLEATLPNEQVSSELVEDLQIALGRIRVQLPTDPTDTVEVIEVTPEVTQAFMVEVTPEVTAEATVIVEVTPEVTEEPPVIIEVTPEVTEEPDVYIVLDPTQYYIYPDGRANVRSGPGTNFEIIGVANQNTPVTALRQSVDGNWFQIRFPNGLVGWVFAGLLDDTPGQSTNTGNPNDNSDGGNSNGSSNGNGNGSSNGNGNGSSNGNGNGNANGNSNGNANGNSNGNANGNSNGNANGNSNGNSNGNANGNSNGN